jgi:phospholipid/cholesterol/gamma-HCH transport system permease protein
MTASPSARPESGPELTIAGAGAQCAGAWTVDRIGQLERRLSGLDWPDGDRVAIDASGMTAMDTAGAWLLQRALHALESAGREVALSGLRPEHEALLRMVRDLDLAGKPAEPEPGLGVLGRVGRRAWYSADQALGMLAFLGEAAIAVLRSAAHPSRIRWREVLRNVQTAGFDALALAGLLSFLMGIVIAYQVAAQLARYGANIFVADLVGLAMLRELSPLLTAIIVAGRSGSSYAAEIGTRKVTEEIDALRTVGIAPMDLLVLPKIAALVIALPLLSVYADVLGVLGGMIMAKAELGVSYADFLDRFPRALHLPDFLVGIGKAPVFAGIIAVVGCYQGFQVAGDAESVGQKTTESVVQSIFLVIVADALFSVAFSWLRI